MNRSNYDAGAVAYGAVAEAVVVPALFVADASPGLVLVVAPAVGGVVAGASSGMPGDEHVDGAFAGAAGVLLGTVLTPLVAVPAGLPGVAAAGLLGVMAALVIGIPIGLFVGAASGYLAARARHRPLVTTG